MSPMMNDMLVNEVMPRLRNSVRSVSKVGHEDDEETVQDSTLMAARSSRSDVMSPGRQIDGMRPGWESDLRSACPASGTCAM
jgi:hypothetical protein